MKLSSIHAKEATKATDKNQKPHPVHKGKKPYRAPHLVSHGSVADVTQAKHGLRTDGASNNSKI